MIDFKGTQFEREIILWGVRWYVAYPIGSIRYFLRCFCCDFVRVRCR